MPACSAAQSAAVGWEAAARSASAEGQSRKFFFLKRKNKKGKGAPKNEWKNFLLCSPQGERRRWAGLPPCGRQLSGVPLEKGSSGVVKLHMDFLSLSSDDIRSGKLKSTLPELYELRSVVENNAWHLKQNVFDHVLSVFEGLEKVLKLEFAKPLTNIQDKQGKTANPGHEVLGSHLGFNISARFGLNRKSREHLALPRTSQGSRRKSLP